MQVLLLITYSTKFGNEIIEYFKLQNPHSIGHKTTLISIGIDQKSDEDVLQEIYEKLNSINSLTTIVIFSDAGIPTKISKRIQWSDENVQLYKAKGSLVENGFLTYMMLNTRAPKETFDSIMNDIVEK